MKLPVRNFAVRSSATSQYVFTLTNFQNNILIFTLSDGDLPI